MAFRIRMGVLEMEAFWNDLSTRKQNGRLEKDEEKFFKKWVKALGYLSADPRHNSLASHEIEDLTRNYGIKFFNLISRIRGRRLDGCSGPMVRTRETSQSLRSSRIPRTRNVAPISGS